VGRGKKKKGIKKKQRGERKGREGKLFRFQDLWLIGCSSGRGLVLSPGLFLEAKREEPVPERVCTASTTVVGVLGGENLDRPRYVLALG